MNRVVILLLTSLVACSLATPTNYASNSKSAPSYVVPAVTILKQIHQLNEDGSYTFGYEASDGSFRVENMDTNGYLTGRYGYVDSYGKTQETEYVAGKMSGQSVGFQARGSLISEVGRSDKSFPFIRSASTKSAEQKAFDYQYTSVDDDEDGLPDVVPARINYNTAQVVRLSTPAQVSYDNAPTTIVRAADSYDPIISNVRTVTTVSNNNVPVAAAPTIVRVADPYTATISDVRVVAPQRSNAYTVGDVRLVSSAQKSYDSAPMEVRVGNSYAATGLSDVRVLTPSKTFSQLPTAENVRLVAPEVADPKNSRSSYGSTNTVVRVTDQSEGYGEIADVRVAAPNQVSYDQAPTIVRIANREKTTYDTIVQQAIDQPSKTTKLIAEVPVFRSPNYERPAVHSTGRLDEFLRSLKTNNRNGFSRTYGSGGSGTTFVGQDQFIQPTQEFQVNQDDAVSIDSDGFTRII